MFRGRTGVGLGRWGYCIATQKGIGPSLRQNGIHQVEIRHKSLLDDPVQLVSAFELALKDVKTMGLSKKLFLSLPLESIELVSLKMPMVPQEAVRDALKFRLKKVVSRPIEDYSFDFIEIKQESNAIQFEVYLLERTLYEALDGVARDQGLTISAIEPDIFSVASSLIATRPQYSEGASTMVLAIWPDSISLGILDKDRICVSRTINLALPQSETLVAGELDEGKEEGGDLHGGDLLSRFGIIGEEGEAERQEALGGVGVLALEDEKGASQEGLEPPISKSNPMDQYCEDLLVQIMRTRDYYTSILKMGAMKRIAILGPEEPGSYLVKCIKEEMDVDVEFMADPLCEAARGVVMR